MPRMRTKCSLAVALAWPWLLLCALLLVVGIPLAGGEAPTAAACCADAGWRSPVDPAHWAAAEDGHEEAALGEGVPEASDDDAAPAASSDVVAAAFVERVGTPRLHGSWRRAPARQKSSRGPPDDAN